MDAVDIDGRKIPVARGCSVLNKHPGVLEEKDGGPETSQDTLQVCSLQLHYTHLAVKAIDANQGSCLSLRVV